MTDAADNDILIHVHELLRSRGSENTLADVQRMQFDQPTLICLGGLASVSVEAAKELAEKNTKDLLGEDFFNDKMRLYTVSYPIPGFKDSAAIIEKFHKSGRQVDETGMVDRMATQLLDKHLEPVVPEVKGLSGQERDLKIEETGRILGNINFFAFSFGTILLRHIHKKMDSLLDAKGFDSSEREMLMQRVKALTIGEVAHWRYKHSSWHYKSVHLTSHNDEVVRPMASGHKQDFATEPVRLEKPTKNMLVIHASLPKTAYINVGGEISEHDDPRGHSAETHTGLRFGPGTLFTRTMMQSALRNMMKASEEGRPIGNPEEVLQSVPLRDANEIGYLGRVDSYGYEKRLQALLAVSTAHGFSAGGYCVA